MIIYVDVDSFFARLEELRHNVINEPVVVVSPGRKGGIIVSVNDQAKKEGIRPGMFLDKVKGKNIHIFLLDKAHYAKISNRIKDVLSMLSPNIETDGLGHYFLEGDIEVAKKIKDELWRKFKITAKIGLGKNKTLAILAARASKPNTIKVLTSVDEVLDMPVTKLPIRPLMINVLLNSNIKALRDLRSMSYARLEYMFGPDIALRLYNLSRGIGDTYLVKEEVGEEGKVISFKRPTKHLGTIKDALENLVAEILKEKKPFTLTSIYVFFNDNSFSFASTKHEPMLDKSRFLSVVNDLLKKALFNSNKEISKIGVFVGSFKDLKQNYLNST